MRAKLTLLCLVAMLLLSAVITVFIFGLNFSQWNNNEQFAFLASYFLLSLIVVLCLSVDKVEYDKSIDLLNEGGKTMKDARKLICIKTKQIDDATMQINTLRNRNKILEFIYENPPFYKTGEKVGDKLIIACDVNQWDFEDYKHKYTVFDLKKHVIEDLLQDELIKFDK